MKSTRVRLLCVLDDWRLKRLPPLWFSLAHHYPHSASFPKQIRPESPRGQWTWRSLWARASCCPVRWPATLCWTSPSPGPSTDSSSQRQTATSSWWAGWATETAENVWMDIWHLLRGPSLLRSAPPQPLDQKDSLRFDTASAASFGCEKPLPMSKFPSESIIIRWLVGELREMCSPSFSPAFAERNTLRLPHVSSAAARANVLARCRPLSLLCQFRAQVPIRQLF